MTQLVLTLNVLRTLTGDLTRRARPTHPAQGNSTAGRDIGASTLEIVVIALGLFLVAGVLVAAITAAVNTRLGQIN